MMRWHSAIGVAVICLGLGGTSVLADERTDAAHAMLNCAAIEDRDERLGCYDAAAGRLKAAMAPPSREKLIADFGAPAGRETPPPTPQPQAQPQATQGQQTQTAAVTPDQEEDEVSLFGVTLFGKAKTEEEFGEEQVKRASEEEGLESITALVSDFGFTPLGDAIVFLENGQVWRQTDGPKVKFPNNPQDRRVTISKAMMGSYTMVVGESKRSVRVRRVK
jgi:hypothetical protein